jgi:hypothetical protein
MVKSFNFPALLDCLGVQGDRPVDGWAARSNTMRPGSAENGAGGLPLPGLMRIERLGKPTIEFSKVKVGQPWG